MSRKIAFRAWDGESMYPLRTVPVGELGLRENETVMQFTGLFDKNGKEVFEGDVVQLAVGWIWVMKWGEDLARFYLIAHAKSGMKNSRGEDRRYIMETANKVCKGEVIGNIYENPELLVV